MGFHIPTGKDYKIEHYFETWGPPEGLCVWVRVYQLKTFRLFFLIPITYWSIVKFNGEECCPEKHAIRWIKKQPLSKWDKMELKYVREDN